MSGISTASVSLVPVRQLYARLSSILKELAHLSGIQGLLDWDQNVMMPEGAADSRACQMSALAGVLHEKSTSKDLGSLLDQLNAHPKLSSSLNSFEQANVRDATRNYEKDVKIPAELAKKLAELSSRGYTVWVEAREKSDFQKFSPVLKEWISLLKQKAAFIDNSLPVYQVLLDDYERGMKVAQLDDLFQRIKIGLIPLIAKINEKPVPDASFLDTSFDIDTQKKLNLKIATDIGFDLKNGRLDVSVHPFTGGAHATDVRMTTRYKSTDLIEGITGTIHETGHALYEQGRSKEYVDLPVSQALSMGLHESQSLFWERMIGLHPSFWKHFWPVVQSHFPQLSSATHDQFHKVINTSKPGFIRVESDEVTYPLHIIIRYEIERGLFDGSIEVDDLPRIWNEKMMGYLGVVPDNDKVGILQDTHWAVGLFGYFPTYTLGAIYACQFYECLKEQMPDIETKVENGQFSAIKSWLNKNIHEKGSLLPSGDLLVREVTGKSLDSDIFLNYLTKKYSKLYNL